jgi:hypothetical protein
MAKESISVKSNGLRNELKEIRKSIDNLTNVILMAQTHKQHDKNFYTSFHPLDDGMRWTTTDTNSELQADDERSLQGQPSRS